MAPKEFTVTQKKQLVVCACWILEHRNGSQGIYYRAEKLIGSVCYRL
jgi:hypothetical protein